MRLDTEIHIELIAGKRVSLNLCCYANILLKSCWLYPENSGGSVQPGHLDAFLDEFVFRFNRRSSGSRGMLFYRLLQ